MALARVFTSIAAAIVGMSMSLAVGVPAAKADALDAIKDTVNRDRGNVDDQNCYPYFYDPALEGIAQAYARSENIADVNNAPYDGEKVAFLGSGDPQAAATNSAYRRGAGPMINNCAFGSFGVGFVRHEDREVDVVTIVFGKHKLPEPKPEVKHEVNPVGPPPGPCPSGNYKFAGTVIFDAEDFSSKSERGTVITVPSTPDGKIAGQADASFAGPDHSFGRADGKITGSNVVVAIAFDNSASAGIFAGRTLNLDGYVLKIGGARGSMNTDEGREVEWHTRTTDSIVCAGTTSADAAPAEAAPKTAIVNKPTDIFDKPDGVGTPYKNADGDNIFKPAGEVQLVVPDLCRDDWCHVVAPEVPGPAWIYAGEGFVTGP